MSTINNDIPFVPENTTDPAAGLNQSLNVIDALLQIAVLGIQSAPPGAPVEGDRYIVSPTGTADWAGHDNQLARYLDGAWQFYDARIAVNLGDSRIYSFDGTAWTDPAGGGVTALQPGDNVSELVNDVPYVETVNGETGPAVVLDADDIDDTATTNKFATQAQLDAADGALQAVNNLLDVADAPTARSNLGLGTAATANTDDFATGAEGDLASTALQPSGNLSGLASNETARDNLGLGTFATYDYSGAPFINVMPDSGRFTGKVNPLVRNTVEPYTDTSFFSGFNGATRASSGKFIHNNTTNGGTAGAITSSVQDLLAAMGRTGGNARYGVEFHVMEVTAGAGTSIPSDGTDSTTRYALTTNGDRALFASSTMGTCAMWIRASTGSVHILSEYYLDGVLQPTRTPVPSGFHHVRVLDSRISGYSSTFPYIYAEPGSVVEIACPAFFTGIVDTGIHTAPIPTINELSA